MLGNHENLTTLFVLLLTPILFITELAPWVVVIGGTVTIIWMSRQFYLSFKNRKFLLEKRAEERKLFEQAQRDEERKEEEHQLKMAILRKQLGETPDASEKVD